MATTTSYTPNFGIKLIGDGREAGTWGTSTNENFKRLEAAIGGIETIDILAMPTGSSSASVNGLTAATWITVDSADDGEPGAEGRCRVVDVTSAGGVGAVTGNATLEIRGGDSGEIPSRVYFIRNSITDPYTLTLNTGGTDYVLNNGNMAIVAVNPTAKGSWAAGVSNLLDGIQMGDIEFATGATLNFTAGTTTFEIPESASSALRIWDGTDTYLTFDTSTNEIEVKQNFNTTDMGTFIWEMDDGNSTALQFQAPSGTNYLQFDTLANDVKILQDLVLADDVFSTGQATDWNVIDSDVSALSFDSATYPGMINIDTSAPRVQVSNSARLETADQLITGTDGYIQMDSWNATPADGYGIRNDSGDIQVKHSGEDWGDVHSTAVVSGNGVYFESTEITMSNGSTSTQTHGLGAVPRQVLAVLRCTDVAGHLGYSENDEIQVACGAQNAGNIGISIFANATSVGYQNGSGGIPYIQRRDSPVGGEAQINYSKWALVIKAWL